MLPEIQNGTTTEEWLEAGRLFRVDHHVGSMITSKGRFLTREDWDLMTKPRWQVSAYKDSHNFSLAPCRTQADLAREIVTAALLPDHAITVTDRGDEALVW